MRTALSKRARASHASLCISFTPPLARAPTGGEGAAEADSHVEAGNAFNAAHREYEPHLFAEIRDGWVRRHMATRAADYTTHIPIAACVLTWNVAAKKPPAPMELAALIGPLADGCALLVVGLQVGARARRDASLVLTFTLTPLPVHRPH